MSKNYEQTGVNESLELGKGGNRVVSTGAGTKVSILQADGVTKSVTRGADATEDDEYVTRGQLYNAGQWIIVSFNENTTTENSAADVPDGAYVVESRVVITSGAADPQNATFALTAGGTTILTEGTVVLAPASAPETNVSEETFEATGPTTVQVAIAANGGDLTGLVGYALVYWVNPVG